jgi:hypothetical protein
VQAHSSRFGDDSMSTEKKKMDGFYLISLENEKIGALLSRKTIENPHCWSELCYEQTGMRGEKMGAMLHLRCLLGLRFDFYRLSWALCFAR